MKNMNIYEIIGMEFDPVYQAIDNMEIGEERVFHNIAIRRLDSVFKYQLESEDYENCYKSLGECYFALNNLLIGEVI